MKLSKLAHRKKPKLSVKEEAQDPKITFSESKIEQMKKLAQLLSKKIAHKTDPQCSDKSDDSNFKSVSVVAGSKSSDDDTRETAQNADIMKIEGDNVENEDGNKEQLEQQAGNGTPLEIYGPDGQIVREIVQELKSKEYATSETVKTDNKATEQKSIEKSPAVSTDENDNHTKKSDLASSDGRSHRKRRHKDSRAKFEGHVVPNLVKCKKVKKSREEEEKEEAAKSQDDYVLHKLFSKSGRCFKFTMTILNLYHVQGFICWILFYFHGTL